MEKINTESRRVTANVKTQERDEWIRTLTDLMQDQSVRPKPIIEKGILNEGSMLLVHGKPKTKKSMLVKNMALCLANGSPWIGFKVYSPQRVLYIQAELPPYALKTRFKSMISTMDIERFGNDVLVTSATSRDLSSQEKLDEISNEISSHNVDVIIVDPLVDFHRAGNENDNLQMSAVMRGFRTLNQMCNTSMVIVHHDGKDPFKSGGDSSRGASAIFGAVDADISIKEFGGEQAYTLTFKLRHDECIDPVRLQFDKSDLTFKTELNQKIEILNAVVRQQQPVSRLDLVSHFKVKPGFSKSSVYEMVNAQLRAGNLIELKKGLIALPEFQFPRVDQE